MEGLQYEFGADIVVSHLNVWPFLLSALKSEKDRDTIFKLFPGGCMAFFG